MKQKRADILLNLLSPELPESKSTRLFNRAIMFLIALSVGLVIADTFDDMPAWYTAFSTVAEILIVIAFTLEYALRFWAAGRINHDSAAARLRYVVSGSSIIDLLAIMPFYIALFFPANLVALRTLRVLRLLRLMKAGRYTKALSSLGAVIKTKSDQLISSLVMISLLLVVASTLMYTLEHDIQPEVFRNAFSGLYWAVETVTSVGYGDLYPITPIGQLLGIVIALLGVAFIAVPTGIISAGLIEAHEKER